MQGDSESYRPFCVYIFEKGNNLMVNNLKEVVKKKIYRNDYYEDL